MSWTGPADVDWASAAGRVAVEGWVRLAGCLDAPTCARLSAAAPGSWRREDDVGSVRQAGVSTGVPFDAAADTVRALGTWIREGLDTGRPARAPEVPPFNEASWSRSDPAAGHHFISAHRDPSAVGGVIAIATLTGRALFRVWGSGGVNEWLTGEGDVVVLRGNGWPTADALCPLHEVDPPEVGGRMILTLRHNLGGAGAAYFA